MVRARFEGYLDRIRFELHSSFTEEYTPHEIAASFAVGTFITMLPTLGTGVLVFFLLIYLFDRINKIALFASVLVFNPVVKWGVYAASFTLGFLLLGPVDGFGVGDTPSMNDGSEIIVRLLVGNTILAVIATVVAYIVVYRLVVTYQHKELPVVEETVEQFVEELEGQTEMAGKEHDETVD